MSLRVFHPLGDPPGPWAMGQRLRLEPDESRYLLRVRRAKVGAQLEVLDGATAAWRAQLAEVDGKTAVVELLDPRPAVRELPLILLLVVPEPRATLEALARASETGATAVHLIVGQHSPGSLPSPPRVAKTLRASQRQCGRPGPPQVGRPGTLQAALAQAQSRPGFVASPAARGR
ncbi:MAG: RNA methyltransferase PUA domain-containing protein, partial [Nannocystaceae bacterium]